MLPKQSCLPCFVKKQANISSKVFVPIAASPILSPRAVAMSDPPQRGGEIQANSRAGDSSLSRAGAGGLVPVSPAAHPQGDTGQGQCLTWLCRREVMPGLGTAALCRGCGRWGVLNPSSACKWSVKIAQIPSSAGICRKPWACWDCCSHLGHRLEHGDTHRSPVCHCTPTAPTNPLWFGAFRGCLHGNQPRMV